MEHTVAVLIPGVIVQVETSNFTESSNTIVVSGIKGSETRIYFYEDHVAKWMGHHYDGL